MTGHLGPLAAALVDDQLDGGDRARALRHVAECAACRFEVDQQRAVKARLDGLGEPMLPGSLFDKLQAMRMPPVGPDAVPPVAASQPEPVAAPRQLPLAVGSGLRGRSAPVTPLPLNGIVTGRAPRSRVRAVLVGATSLVLLGGGAAYAAGGSSDSSGTPVQPAVDVYTVQHGTTSGTVPLNDPAVSAVTVGLGR